MSFFKPSSIVRFVNATQGSIVCEKGAIADSFWTRGKGLLGRKSLPEDEGIYLAPGKSIHMFGMKFAIDVVFLTKGDVVADLTENLKIGRMYNAKAHGGHKPWGALELPPGTVARSGTRIGDQLKRETAGS